MRATPLLAVAVAAAALAATGCGGGGTSAAPAPAPQAQAVSADPHGTPLTEARTVVLRTGTITPSPRRAELHTRLTGGTMPARTMMATVLTDEDCEPDAAGISHCRNQLRMADGSTITVRHHHRMQMVPCLAPGEEVRVIPS